MDSAAYHPVQQSLTRPTRFSADPATGSGPCFLSLGLLGTDLDIPCGAFGAEEEEGSPFAETGKKLIGLVSSSSTRLEPIGANSF